MLQLNNREKILHEETASRVKNSLKSDAGKIILTDKRVVFVKENESFLSSIRLKKKVSSDNQEFTVDLEKVTNFYMTPSGKHKYMLMIESEGIKKEKFVIDSDFAAWESALNRPVYLV